MSADPLDDQLAALAGSAPADDLDKALALHAASAITPTVKQTGMGAVQAAASGLNAGAADILGLPVDTARQVVELGKAGLGSVYQGITGKPAPELLQPGTAAPDFLSSDYIKNYLRKGSDVDVRENTPINRLIHGTTEAVPSAISGGGETSIPKAVLGGAAAGAAGTEAQELGLGPTGSMAAAILAGHTAARVTRGTAEANPTLDKAHELGLAVPPATTNPNLATRALEGVAGKLSVEQASSIKNQPKFDDLAREELGLPKGEDNLHPENLQAIRNEQGQHYAAVAAQPEIKFGPEYNKELGSITAKADKIASSLPNYRSSGANQIQELVQSIKPENGVMDGETAVELSKTLRADGNALLSSAARTADPSTKALGLAHMKAATAVENAVQDHLESIGKPELADNWDNARRTIAKTYSVESALDGSGHVDVSKLAKQQIKGKPLSGNLDFLADFGNAYPKAARVGAVKESKPGASPWDYAIGAIGGGGGGAGILGNEHAVVPALTGALAYPLARMGARALATTKPGQALGTPQGPLGLTQLPNQ